MLEGLDTLILDALRPEPHPTHFNLEQALARSSGSSPARVGLI